MAFVNAWSVNKMMQLSFIMQTNFNMITPFSNGMRGGGETTNVGHRATAKLKAHTAPGHDEHIIKPLYIVTEHMNRAQFSSWVKLGG